MHPKPSLAPSFLPVILLLVAASHACSSDSMPAPAPVTLVSLALSPSNPSIAKGTVQQFAVKGTFSDDTVQDLTTAVIWNETDLGAGMGIAAVAAQGLATGRALGQASIGVSYQGKTATTVLTVTAAELTALTLSPSNPSLAAGTTQQFSARGSFSDQSMQDLSAMVVWTSADVSGSDVASLSAAGVATAKSPGRASITASLSGKSATTTMTTTPAVLVSLALAPSNPSLAKGTAELLTATGTYSDGSIQNLTGLVSFSATDLAPATNVAVLGSGGSLSANAVGQATITASLGGKSATTTLTVTAAVLTSLALAPSNPSLARGTTQQFHVSGTYSDGSLQDLTTVASLVASDATGVNVASISAQGLGTAKNLGQAVITASLLGKSAATSLTVTPAVLSDLAVNPSNPALARGTTQQFTATGVYSDGTTQNVTTMVSWTSADVSGTDVASVNSAGVAAGKNLGRALITASLGGKSTTSTLTVTAAALTALAISPSNPLVPLGFKEQLAVQATYSDGTTQDVTSLVSYFTSDLTGTNVAAIDAHGLATSKSVGQATLTAALMGKTAATTLTVSSPTLIALALSPQFPSIAKGTTQQFTVLGTYSDGSMQDMTNLVSWTIFDLMGSNVASLGNSGLATAKNIGQASVRVSCLGVSDLTTLTVNAAALTALAIGPSNPSIAKGTTQQFTATGTYSDGSFQNVTGMVLWTATDVAPASNVASLSSSGLAIGTTQGQATITASLGGKSASTLLSVTPAALTVLVISPTGPTIAKGTTQQFTVMGTYTDGSTQNLNTLVAWTAQDLAPATNVASISAAGLATGNAVGNATIAVSYLGKSAATTLSVSPATLTSLAITPSNPTLRKSTTQQFTATGTYSDGSVQNLSSLATWSIADIAPGVGVAAISAGGLVTANQGGSAIVMVSYGGKSTSTTLAVTTPSVVAIAITPRSISIPLATTQQAHAIATYSDGSTGDVTNQVSWTATDRMGTTVTSVSVNGLVRAQNPGTATLAGSYLGFSDSIPAQVNQWHEVVGVGQSSVSIWGTSSTDLWVAGAVYGTPSNYAAVSRWNGSTWTKYYLPGILATALVGTASNDVWAVSNDNNLYRWDGVSWNFVYTTGGNSMKAGWASRNDDVWYVGTSIYHWNGLAWSNFADPFRNDLNSISGTASDDVWAAGLNSGLMGMGPVGGYLIHWDGSRWALAYASDSCRIRSVWAAARNSVWAVGDSGCILHFDGATWSMVSSPTMNSLDTVWGSGPADVWAGGQNATMLHYDGATWQSMSAGVIGPGTYQALWGFGASDVWALESGSVLRYP